MNKMSNLLLISLLALSSAFSAQAMQINKEELNKQLVEAAEQGNLGEVRRHIESGADVNAREFIFGDTALMEAADNGHEHVVTYLLARGANVYAKSCKDGMTALYTAGMSGHQRCGELLVEEMLRPIKQRDAVFCFLCCCKKAKDENSLLMLLPKDIVQLIAKRCWVKMTKAREEIKKEISEMGGNQKFRQSLLDKYFPN